MAVSLKHGFTSAIADDPAAQAAGEVLPSHWNAEHTLTQGTGKLLGRTTAGTGATEEITPNSSLTLAATALSVTSRTIDGIAFDHTADVTVIAPATHAASSKATPVDADELPLVDSAASNVLKRLTWANLKATLKAYFDTLYPNASLFAITTTANALADNNTVQNIFPSANDALTVEANTAYYVVGIIRITNGTTSHYDSFGLGGTATFTSIGLESWAAKQAAATVSTDSRRLWITSAAMVQVDSPNTNAGVSIRIEGHIRVANAGTIIPQIQFSAAPGGTNQVEPNTYLRLQKIGSDTVASNGSWA